MAHEHETHDSYQAVPGAVRLLQLLRRGSIPTALVTSGQPWKVRAVMDQLGIAGLFAAEVTASDIAEGKPHPECYLLAARALGVVPERCLVFEDAVSGVDAAVAAGAVCIGVAESGRAHILAAAGARYIVPDFSSVDYRDGVLALGNGACLPLGPGLQG
jgi:HAD superfamily hydrolase (TIGR01509 family)